MANTRRRTAQSDRFPAGASRSSGRHVPLARRGTPARAAFLVHLFGAIALLVSLFLPLTDLGAALASPGLDAASTLARLQENDDETAPT
ncbi:MAG: hypothetical protein H0W06_07820, partial [Chloroflexia bacterium]|nr:hypothetical protein [Chloroflexia bacterium]